MSITQPQPMDTDSIVIGFFRGVIVEVDDHRWVPTPDGEVLYTYQGKDPVFVEALDAAIEASRIMEQRAAWA